MEKCGFPIPRNRYFGPRIFTGSVPRSGRNGGGRITAASGTVPDGRSVPSAATAEKKEGHGNKKRKVRFTATVFTRKERPETGRRTGAEMLKFRMIGF